VSANTSGSVLRGRDLGGLSVEETLMPPGLVVPEHRHEGAQLYFLLEGEYAETLRGKEHRLRPGAAWYRPPGEPHLNAVLGAEPALTLILTVDERRFSSLARRPAGSLPSLLLDEARRELTRELDRGDSAAALAVEGWALLLLSRVERLGDRADARAPGWLVEAVSYLDRHSAGRVSLSSAAAHVGVHPATLAAAFRRFKATSVGEYVRELRLAHARSALERTRRPLEEIASEAGFFDQAHLGRLFRRRFGVTPAAYRRQAAAT
jgi:AraC family transcriptional regulator